MSQNTLLKSGILYKFALKDFSLYNLIFLKLIRFLIISL